MACLDNLVVEVPDCVEIITVNAGLIPNTLYTYEVRGYSDSVYSFDVTTDINGAFEIDTSLFPERFFNRYINLYSLVVLSYTDPYCGLANMTICGSVTDRLLMRFIKSNKTTAQIG